MKRACSAVNIVGAGLAGTLLAIVLARRGFEVEVFERREDPRIRGAERGRSINLALAARGLRGLEVAGVTARVAPLLIPMRGRYVHPNEGAGTLLPYGKDETEVIHSVSRETLGRVLIEAGIDWAAEQCADRMLLEVEHDNAPAVALYHRLGFAELARRNDYYGAGRHALVMQKELIG